MCFCNGFWINQVSGWGREGWEEGLRRHRSLGLEQMLWDVSCPKATWFMMAVLGSTWVSRPSIHQGQSPLRPSLWALVTQLLFLIDLGGRWHFWTSSHTTTWLFSPLKSFSTIPQPSSPVSTISIYSVGGILQLLSHLTLAIMQKYDHPNFIRIMGDPKGNLCQII